MTEPLAGQLTISRITSNQEVDYITIEIRYNGTRLRCKVSLHNFGLAVTGMSAVDAEVTPIPPRKSHD